jgi:hypothetical protein
MQQKWLLFLKYKATLHQNYYSTWMVINQSPPFIRPMMENIKRPSPPIHSGQHQPQPLQSILIMPENCPLIAAMMMMKSPLYQVRTMWVTFLSALHQTQVQTVLLTWRQPTANGRHQQQSLSCGEDTPTSIKWTRETCWRS